MFPIHYGILILAIIYSVSCDCGAPGHSKLCTVIEKNTFENNTYPERYRITYECSEGILVGYWQRYCVGGRWSQTIPKCATALNTERDVVTTSDGKNIYINWPTPAAVVGFKVRLITNSSAVPFESIYGIPGSFSWSVPLNEDPRYRVAYTAKEAVDMTNYVNITSVNATFGIPVGVNQIDTTSVTLFHLNEYIDDCERPDSSLHSTSSVIKDNLGTRAAVTCNNGFTQDVNIVTCPKNGDWESYDNAVNCEPTTSQ